MKPGKKAMLSEAAPMTLQCVHGNLAVLTFLRPLNVTEYVMQHDRTLVEFVVNTEDIVFISDEDAQVQRKLYADAIEFSTRGSESST